MSTQSLFTDDSLRGSRSLDGATTTANAPTAKAVGGARQISWFLQAVGVCTAGIVVFEHNEVAIDYSGTWAVFDTHNFTTDPLTDAVRLPATYPGHLEFVRWRITTNITGGGNIVARVNGLRP